jgi:hypothetical protein
MIKTGTRGWIEAPHLTDELVQKSLAELMSMSVPFYGMHLTERVELLRSWAVSEDVHDFI